jgi:hypothetical protein
MYFIRLYEIKEFEEPVHCNHTYTNCAYTLQSISKHFRGYNDCHNTNSTTNGCITSFSTKNLSYNILNTDQTKESNITHKYGSFHMRRYAALNLSLTNE